MEEIIPANIQSTPGTPPYAPEFQDFYYSKNNGLEESRYVFLEGNHLPQYWQNKPRFVIAETGFGTGLNFLATCQAWQNDPSRCKTLHYISIEKHPIPGEQLPHLLNNWSELTPYLDELLTNYPPLLTGIHSISLAGGAIRLTLCFMDISTALNELTAEVDCWYLDGFAPNRNPSMWSAGIMKNLAALGKPGTHLATFTASSQVRRNLESAGFIISKRKGYGKKREMLTARLPDNFRKQSSLLPWFRLPPHSDNTTQTVAVIGGGIAGCQVARSLAERGYQVTLIERHSELAQEASGNPAGVLTPKMTAQPSWGERFYRQAFTTTIRQLKRLDTSDAPVDWEACGAIQLNHNERESKRWQALKLRHFDKNFIQMVNAEQASELAGLPLPYDGSYFPEGGWINPRSYCESLIHHNNIRVLTTTSALTLKQHAADWTITSSSTETPLINSTIVVICSGRDAAQFQQTHHLPFMPVRGQTTSAPATHHTQTLRTTLGHEGYLTPMINGSHIFGATFERDQPTPCLSTHNDRTNQRQLAKYLPKLAEQLTNFSSAHSAIRMTTPDRFPYVGAIPIAESFKKQYADLHHGKPSSNYPGVHYHPNLYIAAGFGSRGLTTSHLSAELLASLINQEPIPLEKCLYYQMHPGRFLVKKFKRKD